MSTPKNKQSLRSWRPQHKFWLDTAIPLEAEMHNKIESLKKQRRWMPKLRLALQLLFTLEKGNTEILEAEFPEVVQELRDRGVTEAIDARLTQLEAHIMGLPSYAGTTSGPRAGPHALAVPDFAAPTYEEDEPESLEVFTPSNGNVSQNFAQSLLRITQTGKEI